MPLRASWPCLAAACAATLLISAQPGVGELRPKARADFREGNFRDAWEKYRSLSVDPRDDPTQVTSDFLQAIQCLRRLGREDEVDSFREQVIAAHSKNWRLQQTAADSLSTGSHFGYIVAGKFYRGNKRGGGEYVNTVERDRVRALQVMQNAMPLLSTEPDKSAVAGFYFAFARQILSARQFGDAWQLLILTDLSKLPDYDHASRAIWRRRTGQPGGAPVDPNGNPVFYRIPSRYESATSDGERWRWALSQVVEYAPVRKTEIALTFANFLHTQFGVQTLAVFGHPFNGGDSRPDDSGPFAMHALKDDETIARLATGVKRFKLPDEFNFIRIYREAASSGNSSQAAAALEALAGIFENRRQFSKSAESWRECIRRFGAGPNGQRAKRLSQIVDNWGRFEPISPQPASPGRTLAFRYRNGRRLDLEAHSIRVEKLLEDVKTYLKSNPGRLDWSKSDIANIGYRLVQQEQSPYLGDRVAQWSVPLDPRPDHFDRLIDVATPLQKAGAYLVTAKVAGGNTSRIVVWLSDLAIVHKQLTGGAYYYVADAVNGTPAAGANVEFFGYRQESDGRNQFQIRTANFAEFTDADGQVVPDAKELENQFQWLITARTKDGRFAYLGFEGVWYGQSAESQYDQRKTFAITDRPVYRPGQTVKFKFWVRRARYDAGDSSEFAGQKFKVRATDPHGKIAFEQTATADSWGGFDGEFAIAPDATLGSYSLGIVDRNDVSGGATFRIEEYKKPEFEVTVGAPHGPVLLGEKIAASVSAKYYFGGPVTQATVHYKVTRSNYAASWYPIGTWDWCYEPGYWWFWPDSTWYPGWKRWGLHRPQPSWFPTASQPPELVLEATLPISSDGTVKIEVDTSLAKAVHGDMDHRYDITAEVVDQSRRTIVGTGQILVARKPFQVATWTDRGYYQVGDVIKATFNGQSLDHKPVKGKAAVNLYRVSYNVNGKPTETAVQSWNLETNDQGNGRLEMKASQAGEYRLSCKLTDEAHHSIEGAVLLTVRGESVDSAQFRFNDLELIADKREYAPGEPVRLLINTNRADSTVALFIRPVSGVYPKPQIVRLKGKSAVVDVPVVQTDMPNFFVEALTISDGRLHTETREIVVPPEKRVVNVAVKPSKELYKPGSKANVTVHLTDPAGKPIVGSIVLAVYDKSVEYISGGTNVPDIRAFFWKWRRQHYPSSDTSLNRSSVNLLKRGETPMNNLGVFGGVTQIEGTRMPMAGRALHSAGAISTKTAAPMFGAPTFGEADAAAAPAIEVQPTVRSQFADTAFWAAHLEADRDGLASVSFPMPENLTTWKIRGWTMAAGTRVGHGEAEVTTSKNLVVRMQSPRFFVETDEVVLSANVHNYLKTAKSVRIALDIEGKTLSPFDPLLKNVTIAAGGEARVDWRVKAVEHGEAVVSMKALTDEESDAMQMHFPVRVHGMRKTESFTGSIRPDKTSASFTINVPSKRRINDTLLEIRFSPTLAGALVDALPYLVRYPHETTDCTLYRFLPTVITQSVLKRMNLDLAEIKNKRTNLNAQEQGDPAQRAAGWKRFDDNPVFNNAEVTRLVKHGVRALTEMQLADGGWGWFSGWQEHSEPHVTAQVVHGLRLAQRNGVALVPEMLERGLDWLKRYQAEQVARLANAAKDSRVEPYKTRADNLDALVYLVLVEADVNDSAMQDYLFRDRGGLSVYANGLFGLALSTVQARERLAVVMANIDQYFVQDEENDTAWLRLPAGATWWFWYDSETEANAYYLKLLSRVDPKGSKAPRLAKYLLNNRKHATYWNSPRDTAIAIEALAEYLSASGEDRPQMTVEAYLDGKKVIETSIDAKNLFTFDNKVIVAGDAVTSGPHTIELRKRGAGPLYFNADLGTFTLEDFIKRAGLEIKIERKNFKLVRDDRKTPAAGSQGQVLKQLTEKYRRMELPNASAINSGDLVEIELTIDSKNDYEHLVFEDPKAAGVEPFDVQSGYNVNGLGAYVQLRDEKIVFFVRRLARGKHSLRYRLRAETPGKFSALPTVGSGMYAPELKGNSDEMKLTIDERRGGQDKIENGKQAVGAATAR